jgi:hypothetical protein
MLTAEGEDICSSSKNSPLSAAPVLPGDRSVFHLFFFLHLQNER